jgi:GT2 family glycosyltransferase
MDENSDVGIMGPAIYSTEGRELKVCRKYSRMTQDFIEWTPLLNRFSIASRNYTDGELDYTRVCNVDYIQGACMIIRRDALEETGLLDERYFMYAEEEDLCRRMKEKGWKIVYNPRIKIKHYWGASTEKEKFNKYDLLVESKFLYFKKFYGTYYANLYKRVLIAIMYFRKYFYSIIVLRGVKADSYRHEKELSSYMLRKLFSLE